MATTHITRLWACHAPDCLLCQRKDGEFLMVQQSFWHCQEVEADIRVLLVVVGMPLRHVLACISFCVLQAAKSRLHRHKAPM